MDPNPPLETSPTRRPAPARSYSDITPEELAKIGRRLYGRRWVPRMAEALGANYSTVSRWSRGLVRPTPASETAIRLLLAQHKALRAHGAA